jgi:arylsulfatase A-like enzyme
MKSQRTRSRIFFAGLLISLPLAIGLAYWQGKEAARPQARNFLLIVIDTLRADHLGAYGSSRNLSPSLDTLANESYLFENAIATSAWTRSSIASMFTSQFPSPLGVLGRKDAIPEEVTTIAEVFQRRGYSTYGVTTNGNAGASFGFAQGFEAFEYPDIKRSYPGGATKFPAEGVTKMALDWLKTRDATKPFFVFLHYTDPHDPYFPHDGLLPGPEPAGRFDGSRKRLGEMDREFRQSGLPQEDMDRIKYLYAGEVKYCDIWIGKLIAGLKELGLWDDLMIIVTADHGEGLWDHSERAHGRDLYEEMIRVPLLVRYPGPADAGGARIATPVSLVDLAPTLLAGAGAPAPAEFRGRDLWNRARRNAETSEQPGIYAELGLDWMHLESVRVGNHKLIRDRRRAAEDDGAYQLFDLSADPNEKRNVMQAAPDVAPRLRMSLADWRNALAEQALAAKKGMRLDQLSVADLESMKALGYLSAEEYEEAIRAREETPIGTP